MGKAYYVITNGSSYVGGGNGQYYGIVDTYKDAVKLKFKQINAVYNNLMEGVLGGDGKWKIVNSVEIKNDLSGATDGVNVNEIMDSLEADFDLLVKRKKVLEVELLEIEREITDIYHAMEFYNLDAAKGYKIYKMMQERLIRRRNNKDETLKIDYILTGGIKGLTSKKTREQFEKMENREYRPRALKELFDV